MSRPYRTIRWQPQRSPIRSRRERWAMSPAVQPATAWTEPRIVPGSLRHAGVVMQPPFSVRPNRRHCRGLTLVEVLIAVVLVTVGLLVTSDVIVAAETATKKGALDI